MPFDHWLVLSEDDEVACEPSLADVPHGGHCTVIVSPAGAVNVVP